MEAPGEVGAVGEADPGGDGGGGRWWLAVVDDGHAPVSCDQVGAIEGPVDAEGLGELGRAAAQIAVAAGDRAPGRVHGVEAFQRRQGAQQDGRGHAVGLGHDVGTPVHAVGEVHVETARRAEHGSVALGLAAEAVAAGVVSAPVGLDLDDAAGAAVRSNDHLVEQLRRDFERTSCVEVPVQRLTAHPKRAVSASIRCWNLAN